MAPVSLTVAGASLPLPVFFPSVSSVKTNLAPSEYVRVLAAMHEPAFLVSAYDIGHASGVELEQLTTTLRTAASSGAVILLDSGNYESYWRGDRSWTAERYAAVLRQELVPVALSFDNQAPPSDAALVCESTLNGLSKDQDATKSTSVCPIVHGLTPELVIAASTSVADRLRPIILAVPERELGDGVLRRARTVRRLRSALDEVSPTTALHLLGTGNPVSMLIYAMSGAGSFDGLEWCQTCADPATARLFHFQQRELVQSMDSAFVESVQYGVGTLVHNLLFFRSWLSRMREALATGRAEEMLLSVLPQDRQGPVIAAMREP